MAGPEGERPHFDRTPQQRTPTEQHKPQLEAGNGTPGIPPNLNERAKPPLESQERQPLPSVWDVLERGVIAPFPNLTSLDVGTHKGVFLMV
jgi:hypothetical protein